MSSNANTKKTEFKKSMVVLNSMVIRNIKNQYRRSVLGVVWTVLNPLLNMLVMAFVFSNIFNRGNILMDYPVYILTGNIVFSLMRMSTTNSLTSIVNNYDLLNKTKIPQIIFPLSNNFSAVVNFGFSLIALLIVMLVRIPKGVRFHATMPMIIFPWLPSILLFCIGLSLILCTIYVRFRDIKHIYSVVLTLWMYMTPILYAANFLGNDVLTVIKFNPMYHYLTYFRNVVALGVVPSLMDHLICYGFGICFFLIGYVVFNSKRKTFILYI
ncbi:MAG TPA: ABC transporter permease [Clostridiales bacterium]|nr:ABC transporter permease [Clostridiales bacterium]